MDEESRRRRTISLDSATLYFSDVLGAFRRVKPDGGASFYFVQVRALSRDRTQPNFFFFFFKRLGKFLFIPLRCIVQVTSRDKIELFFYFLHRKVLELCPPPLSTHTHTHTLRVTLHVPCEPRTMRRARGHRWPTRGASPTSRWRAGSSAIFGKRWQSAASPTRARTASRPPRSQPCLCDLP